MGVEELLVSNFLVVTLGNQMVDLWKVLLESGSGPPRQARIGERGFEDLVRDLLCLSSSSNYWYVFGLLGLFDPCLTC